MLVFDGNHENDVFPIKHRKPDAFSIERRISDLCDFLINVARYAVSDIRTILSIGKRFKCFNHQFVMAVITIPASPKIFGGVIKTRMIMWALNIPESGSMNGVWFNLHGIYLVIELAF